MMRRLVKKVVKVVIKNGAKRVIKRGVKEGVKTICCFALAVLAEGLDKSLKPQAKASG